MNKGPVSIQLLAEINALVQQPLVQFLVLWLLLTLAS